MTDGTKSAALIPSASGLSLFPSISYFDSSQTNYLNPEIIFSLRY
jgi:hypothetical protein